MIKNFIGKLQNSDEGTKKIWLVILSGLTMAIVVAFWASSLNLSFSKPEKTAAAKIENDAPGFFAIFSSGAKTIYDQIREKLSSKNSIVIENPERNFIAETVEPVEATELP